MKSRIGFWIKERGYMKKYIAKQLDVTPTQVSNWISGTSKPPIEKAFKLADLLGVKVDELYDRTDQD
jgi:transcriptional regulator with XRE-family HTH domain